MCSPICSSSCSSWRRRRRFLRRALRWCRLAATESAAAGRRAAPYMPIVVRRRRRCQLRRHRRRAVRAAAGRPEVRGVVQPRALVDRGAGPSLFDPTARVDVTVDHLMVGGVQELDTAPGRAFIGGLFGFSRFAAPDEVDIRLTIGLSAGAQVLRQSPCRVPHRRAGIHDDRQPRAAPPPAAAAASSPSTSIRHSRPTSPPASSSRSDMFMDFTDYTDCDCATDSGRSRDTRLARVPGSFGASAPVKNVPAMSLLRCT